MTDAPDLNNPFNIVECTCQSWELSRIPAPAWELADAFHRHAGIPRRSIGICNNT